MLRKDFEAAKHALDSSKVIAFPTETVMGLGVLYDDFSAYNILNQIKRRPEEKPYTMMLSSKEQIGNYAVIDERANKIIDAFMPGEITVLLNAKENVPNYVTHGTGVIGVRVPNLPELLEFLSYVGKPLLVPSANRSGEKPAMTSDEVKKIFGDELGYVFEGSANGGVPSTLVDLTGKEVKIYREGNIKLADILNVLKGEQ